MKSLLIVSTSTVHGKPYLEYIQDEIVSFFKHSRNIIFVPYARPSGITWDQYTETAKAAFSQFGLNLSGIHEKGDPQATLKKADGIFIGGGNSFVLLDELYKSGTLNLLRELIENGIPYMGTSAGSNILGPDICTTNDMPIVYPPGFEAIGAVPFNINPHYIDPLPDSKHMGETRETRIKEFLTFNDNLVIGLREGSYLRVRGDQIQLEGPQPARIFSRARIFEVDPDDNISFLMNK